MGGISSRQAYRHIPSERPRHHQWDRIQHIPDPGEDSDDSHEADLAPDSDHKNWPKSCPVMHLDINNDFELEAQRKVLRSLYRSWQTVFWTFVLNMVSVVATQLTANVTQPTALEFSFAMTILVLFAYFLFYFRVLYWAFRLESQILYIWFYAMSIVLFALYAYVIVQSITMMSILASPLAPGSQLPVKANPIFPMITHTITLILFAMHIAYSFYYVAEGFKWQFMSDKKKEQIFRKERRKGWMQKFWGKKGDIDDENNGEGYACMLEYEQGLAPDGTATREAHTPPGVGDRLSVPGRTTAENHCISFKADEPVFNHYFTLKAFYADILAMKKQNKTEIHVVERANDERPEEDVKQVYAARSKKQQQAVRLLIFDFKTAKERNELYTTLQESWTTVKKSGDTSHADNSVRATRLRLLRQTREREGNHLLTHKDWLGLVKHVGKLRYKAGQVILEPGGYFDFLFTVSEGSIDINIETSGFTDPGDLDSDSDLEVDELLFPTPAKSVDRIEGFGHEPGELEALRGARHEPNCVYFTIKFRERGMGFKYMKKKRVVDGRECESFIVLRVKPKSQAAIGHLQPGDELVKVGYLNVEQNGISQKRLKKMIKSSTYPMDIQFRRQLDPNRTGAVTEGVDGIENLDSNVVTTRNTNASNVTAPAKLESQEPQVTIMESIDDGGEADDEQDAEHNDEDVLPQPPSIMSTMFEIGDESSLEGDSDEEHDNQERNIQSAPDVPNRITNPFDLESQPSDATNLQDQQQQSNAALGQQDGMNLLELDFAEQMAVMDDDEEILDFNPDDTDDNTNSDDDTDSDYGNPTMLPQPNRPPPLLPPSSVVAPDGSISFNTYSQTPQDDDEQVEFVGFTPKPSFQQHRRVVPVNDETTSTDGVEMVDIVVDANHALEHNEGSETQPLISNQDTTQPPPPPIYSGSESEFSASRRGAVRMRMSPVAGVSGGITFWNQKDKKTLYMPLGEGEEPIPREIEAPGKVNWDGGPIFDNTKEKAPIQRRDSATSIKSYKYRQGIIARSRTFLFGRPFGYQEVRTVSDYYNKPGRWTNRVSPASDDDDDDDASFQFEVDSDDQPVDFDILFAKMSTFETFGKFEKGDTIGIIPWVVNHPVSVVQLVAAEDVVLHGIMLDDLSAEFNKSPSLALAFFKYLASVLGERVDRDEEALCDKYRAEVSHSGRRARQRQEDTLRRLLDGKPIDRTSKTGHNLQVLKMEKVRAKFQRKHDMEFDVLIDSFEDVRAVLGPSSTLDTPFREWFGSDTDGGVVQPIVRHGNVYVTTNYVCFASSDPWYVKVNPFHRTHLKGKIHINDVYNMYLKDNSLVLVTGTSKLTIELQTSRRAVHLYDMVALLRKTTSIEQAPHSYTLSWNRKSYQQEEDASDTAFRQQKALRMEFLGLLEALQDVLTRHDKWRLFKDSRAVTLQRGQSILTASPPDATQDTSDEFPGLYLVGKGELVIQREIFGRRIQFGSYGAGAIFGIERFLTNAPSPCTIKVLSKNCQLRFCPAERAMGLLRSDPALAARFYQYSCLTYMTRVRGPIVSRPLNEADQMIMQKRAHKFENGGCAIL